VTTPATVATITGIPSGSTSLVVTGLTNGTAYTFQVRAVNAGGPGPLSTASAAVTPVAPVAPVAPSAPTAVSAVRGDGSATVTWTDGANGGSPITGYQVQTLRNGGLVKTDTLAAGPQTSTVITGLANGTTYTFRVRAVNAIGLGVLSAATNAVTPATVPAAPGIGTAVSGTAGAPVTATARWNRPANNGGSAITAYRVSALRFNAAGVLQSTTVFTAGANVRTLQMTLAAGTYRFQVRAVNAIGVSGLSARSNLVTAR
jgi:predicted phage tail protein